MVRINADFAALRPEGVAPQAKQPTDSAAPSGATEDTAVLMERHRAIAEANIAASQNRVQDLNQAAAIAQTLRKAIASLDADAFANHGGLSSDRVQSLLQ